MEQDILSILTITDTLKTLAAKLSQYGISMKLSSDGKLYFEGNNNSYMTTNGISQALLISYKN